MTKEEHQSARADFDELAQVHAGLELELADLRPQLDVGWQLNLDRRFRG